MPAFRARTASLQFLWDGGFVSEVARRQAEQEEQAGIPQQPGPGSPSAGTTDEGGANEEGDHAFTSFTSFIESLTRRMSVLPGGQHEFLRPELLLQQIQEEEAEQQQQEEQQQQQEQQPAELDEADAERTSEAEHADQHDGAERSESPEDEDGMDGSSSANDDGEDRDARAVHPARVDSHQRADDSARGTSTAGEAAPAADEVRQSAALAGHGCDVEQEGTEAVDEEASETAIDHHRRHAYQLGLHPIRRTGKAAPPRPRPETETERVARVRALGSLDSRLRSARLPQRGDPSPSATRDDTPERAAVPYREAVIGEVGEAELDFHLGVLQRHLDVMEGAQREMAKRSTRVLDIEGRRAEVVALLAQEKAEAEAEYTAKRKIMNALAVRIWWPLCRVWTMSALLFLVGLVVYFRFQLGRAGADTRSSVNLALAQRISSAVSRLVVSPSLRMGDRISAVALSFTAGSYANATDWGLTANINFSDFAPHPSPPPPFPPDGVYFLDGIYREIRPPPPLPRPPGFEYPPPSPSPPPPSWCVSGDGSCVAPPPSPSPPPPG